MARSLVQVDLPAGNVALIVPWMSLEIAPWSDLIRPLAELVGSAGVWHARPIPDDETDKHAISGH